jgi:hypothetical protein
VYLPKDWLFLFFFLLLAHYIFLHWKRYGLCRYGIEGPVYLTGKGEKGAGDWYVDEEKQKIVKMDGSLSYSVLQTVKIHMEVVEPQPNRPKLQLTLL